MRANRMFLLSVVALALCSPAVAEETAPQTFSGTYKWSQGASDKLNAEFTASGDGTWSIQFHFRFAGNEATWEGEAEGDLNDGGSITGTSGYGSRRWVFSATIEEGVMQGTHAEIMGEKEVDTGTFELKR